MRELFVCVYTRSCRLLIWLALRLTSHSHLTSHSMLHMTALTVQVRQLSFGHLDTTSIFSQVAIFCKTWQLDNFRNMLAWHSLSIKACKEHIHLSTKRNGKERKLSASFKKLASCYFQVIYAFQCESSICLTAKKLFIFSSCTWSCFKSFLIFTFIVTTLVFL